MLRALLTAFFLTLAAALPAQTPDSDLNALFGAVRSGDTAAAQAAVSVLEGRLAAGERPMDQPATALRYVMGSLLFQLGDAEGALNAFRAAVRSAGEEGLAQSGLGFELRYEFASLLTIMERREEALNVAADLVRDVEASPEAASPIARSALSALAVAQTGIADHAGAEATWRAHVARAERAEPADPMGLRLGLVGLSQTLMELDRAKEAIPFSRRARDIAIDLEGAESELGIIARLQYALVLEQAGQLDEAYSQIADLSEVAEATLGAGHETVRAASRALTRIEKEIGDYWAFRAQRRETIETLSDHGDAEERLAALEALLDFQVTELAPAAQQQTLEAIIAHVDAHPQLPRSAKARAQAELANLLTLTQADFATARALFDEALAVLRADLGPMAAATLRAEVDFISIRQTEAQNADLLREAGRELHFSDGSAAAADYSDRDIALYGALAEATAQEDTAAGFMASLNFISVLTAAGRVDRALAVLDQQEAYIARLRQTERGRTLATWLGYQVDESRGRINLAAGQFEEAVAAFGNGQTGLIEMMREVRWASIIEASQEFHRFGQLYGQVYAEAAWQAGQAPAAKDDSFAAAFEAVQLAGYGPAAGSVSRASARKAAEDPVLVSLIGELDALSNFEAGSDITRMTDIQRQIEARHPDYFALQVPEPVPLSAVTGGVIGGDEAMIAILPMGKLGSHDYELDGLVLAVTQEGVAWAELGLPLQEFLLEIMRLHLYLDPGRDLAGTRAPLSALSSAPSPRARPFNFEASTRLYDAIFGAPEVAALIEGKDQWTLVPFYAALPIPYAALAMEAPADMSARDAEALRAVRWLGQEKALTVVPSVAALLDLRARPPREATGVDYLAFGDPAFTGEETALLASADAVITRSGPDRAAQLSALPKLPGTRREVETLAAFFEAAPDAVALGAAATEGRLRDLAEKGKLADARIVHFATHGLLSGAFSGLSEPALALTPVPGSNGPEDDGLLTASEAARLELNADWVILSACDTAGREGVLGDGFGALAQAFFAAGAQSLLLSHWRVDDRAAEALSTGTVTGAAKGLSKAEALREAMRTLASDTSRDGTALPNSHPSVWAPFVLIGAGG